MVNNNKTMCKLFLIFFFAIPKHWYVWFEKCGNTSTIHIVVVADHLLYVHLDYWHVSCSIETFESDGIERCLFFFVKFFFFIFNSLVCVWFFF